jgi:hypothetical protein
MSSDMESAPEPDAEIELVVSSRDPADLAEIRDVLGQVEVQDWPVQRLVDPVAVLTLSAAAAELLAKLLDLRGHLAERRRDRPGDGGLSVTINTADGRTIRLEHATEAELRAALEMTKPD